MNLFRKLQDIESANYGEGMVEEIISVFSVVKNATFGMVIALVIVTAFLISNTIKLTIFSRRSEKNTFKRVSNTSTNNPKHFH